MRENESLSESGKLLYDKVSADDKALQVHERWYEHITFFIVERKKKTVRDLDAS